MLYSNLAREERNRGSRGGYLPQVTIYRLVHSCVSEYFFFEGEEERRNAVRQYLSGVFLYCFQASSA